ncbi:MAG: hypothetical protein DHS20C11_30440 [Lysobacteraceae bacterium]|nr:MAG: hypothetical protein DHS20C11_30440 [Xanthomonadaceae bacterium]
MLFVTLLTVAMAGSIAQAGDLGTRPLEELLLDWEHRAHLVHQHEFQHRPLQLGGTGTIAGFVTAADTMLGLEGYTVWLKNDAGERMTVDTAVDGSYSFSGLAADTYYVGTDIIDATIEYVGEMYTPTGGHPCYRCDLVPEGALALGDGATLSDINLELAVGGTISGSVMAGGTPAEAFQVRAAHPQYWRLPAYTDGAGNYTVVGLPDLDYRVFVGRDVSINFVNEIYPDVRCNPFSCGGMILNGAGVPVSVIGGVGPTDIDFALEPGSVISGVVNDADTMMPITEPFGFVNAIDESGFQASLALFFPPASSYVIAGLLPGEYYLEATERQSHVRELYPNQFCPFGGCNRREIGTPVSVGDNQTLTGIDFYLDRGGHVTLDITDGVDQIDDAYFSIIDESGAVAGGGYLGSGGVISTDRAVPPGVYFIRTGLDWLGNFSNPYVDELLAMPPTSCVGYDCDPTTGTPITVTVGDNNDLGTIALQTGESVSGTVTDLAGTMPLAGVTVLFYTNDMPPVFAAYAETDTDGNFTVSGLLPGQYFALTNNGSQLPFPGTFPTSSDGWTDILYNGHQCPAGACDFHAIGDLITVPSRGAGLSFQQPIGAQISGRITNQATGFPIPQTAVDVYADGGVFAGRFFAADDGVYHTSGLLDGTYYLFTHNAGSMVDHHYGGQPCINGCVWSNATPVVVTTDSPATDIDLALASNRIFGDDFE